MDFRFRGLLKVIFNHFCFLFRKRTWFKISRFGLHEEIGYKSEYHSYHCESGYSVQNGTSTIQGKVNLEKLFVVT